MTLVYLEDQLVMEDLKVVLWIHGKEQLLLSLLLLLFLLQNLPK